MTDQEQEAMHALHRHLLALDQSVDVNDEESRTALNFAFEAYSSLARLIEPALALQDTTFEEPDDE